MGHAMGAVRFKDGTFRYYEYNGTSDIIAGKLYKTEEEVSDNWRKDETKHCECGKAEVVEVFTSYGRGSYYMGVGCKECDGLEAFIEAYNTKPQKDNWALTELKFGYIDGALEMHLPDKDERELLWAIERYPYLDLIFLIFNQ